MRPVIFYIIAETLIKEICYFFRLFSLNLYCISLRSNSQVTKRTDRHLSLLLLHLSDIWTLASSYVFRPFGPGMRDLLFVHSQIGLWLTNAMFKFINITKYLDGCWLVSNIFILSFYVILNEVLIAYQNLNFKVLI